MDRIPQSVAKRVVLKAYLASDHVSPATGKTIAIVISKNGGAFANPSAGATNATAISNGWYYVDLSTTDTGTAGTLVVRGTEGTIDDLEVAFEVANAFNAGFTGVPGAAAESAGGLFTRGTGAGQINQTNNGQIDVNAARVGGTTQTGRDIGASVLLSSGTGTGQLLLASGKVDLAAAAIQAIWDALTSALTTVGSIGKLLADRIDAAISSRSTYAGADTSGTTTLLSRLTSGRADNLDNLDETVSSRLASSAYTAPLDEAGVRAAIGLASANLDTQLGALATAADLSTVAGNVSTILAAVDTEVAAIKAKTDNLPSDPADASDIAASFASISSALSTIAGYIDTEVAAIKAKTDLIPASPAAVSDIPTAAQNADKLLGRSLAGGADGGRTVQDALRPLRNKVDTDSEPGYLIVMEEDDTTEAWRAVVTTDAAAEPIVAVDPA